MRARYAAYALGDVRFVMNTTDPEGPHYRAERGDWKAELEAWCRATRFEGLEVIEAQEHGDVGMVHFVARLATAEGPHRMEERSRFRKRGRRWLYVAAA